jgi:hypothetical protein
MPKVPDLARVSAKWSQNAGNATSTYTDGVQNPKEDWKTATLAAKENYKAGVQKSITDDRFSKGVNRTSTDKQIQASVQKGSERFSAGIALAGPDFEAGMAPVLAVIASTNLPPRKPKGDASNIQRVAALAAAQHAAKLRR